MLINLLPTNEKEFLRLEKIYRSIIFFSRILFAILLILIVLLLAILFFLKIQLAGIEKARSIESQSASAIAIKALKSEISFINQKLMDINRLQTEHFLPRFWRILPN